MSAKFSPTPEELTLVSQIFAQADPQKIGILTGEVAVRVFSGAKLQPTILGKIWSIADEANNGWLSKKGVSVAIRLMGWAQNGEEITPALVNKPGPIPTIEGIAPVVQHTTGTSLTKSPPPGLPPLTSQDKAKFQALFVKSGPTNGLLSGEKARDFFVKSGLSNEKLLQIWNLADTQDRGALDSTDFAIGMYFIQGLMSGQLSFIPTSLPPGLYQQAGGNPSSNPDSVRSHTSGNSGSFSPTSGAFPQNRGIVRPQYTGQSQLLQSDHQGFSTTQLRSSVPLTRPNASGFSSPPFVPQRNGQATHWDVTPAEKAKADTFFDELDTHRRSYIEGDVAVPFLLKSNLPSEDLAQVWDLADINNDGRLTRDGFAVAMYLIQKKLTGAEIPAALPPSLLPPSMRTNGASPFSSSLHQSVETTRNLLWDDTPPSSASVSQPEPPSFTSTSTSAPAHDPFGSSSFNSMSHHDLLGDDEEVEHNSPPLHDQSAEIGNVQNQLNSTNRSLDTVKNERATIEQTLANQASQLSALQTQLSSAKAAYETETKLLATLHERHSRQITEMQKSREELIRAESDLSAVRVEKAEVEGAFLRDKEEARELHRKMVEVGQQVDVLKLEVEKAKKDAKQQKGLLAIARKQLSTKEAEKAKVEKESEEANAEVASIIKEKEEAEAEAVQLSATPTGRTERALSSDSLTFAASQAIPISPDPSSPAGSSIGKSNNPFERLTASSGTPRPQSPFLPFSGSSVSTPSVQTNDTLPDTSNTIPSFDPFGFSQTHYDAVQTSPPAIPGSGTSTPKHVAINTLGSPTAPNTALSSSTTEDNDQFVTPPTTAGIHTPPTTSSSTQILADSPTARFATLDDAASQFPDIEADSNHLSVPDTDTRSNTDVDLSAQLKELEVDESDSDSEDEVPLADLAKSKIKDVEPTPTHTSTTPQPSAPGASFDDIFGVTPSTVAGEAPKPASSMPLSTPGPPVATNALESPKSVPASVAETTPQPKPLGVSGVNAFDEAMGAIPSAETQKFTFDSAFDDNFDFASATETSFPPVPNTTSGHKDDGFDSIFVTPSGNNTHTIPNDVTPISAQGHAVVKPPTASDTLMPTFDEAFSGFDSGPTLDLQSSFPSSLSKDTVSATGPIGSPVQTTFPGGTTSPKAESTSSRRPVSPSPRARSPPLRMSSPKPRLSTSSSKETPDKAKETTTRHSKLSIRLPFGKKKRQQQEPLPAPPSHLLTPPQEESLRAVSPAVDDDVEAVKQLTAMGFSRTQAVDALEKYGYDVQKALNSLLGAP